MNISEILKSKIEAGEALVKRTLDIPNGVPSQSLIGFVQYNHQITDPILFDAEQWQLETTELLITLYGEKSRQVNHFKSQIGNKNHYLDFRDELTRELRNCLIHLNALVKADETNKIIATMPNQDTVQPSKTPMAFISHSSKDKQFVEALVDLLESIGLNENTLFCSSVDGYGVKLNDDIFETILSLFKEHDLYVIFIHSPNYYLSPVSLNEMGAAWVLKTKFCSILTKEMSFEMMKGVVNQSKMSIKVDADEASARLNELKDQLIQFFGLSSISQTPWERKRNKFLSTVKSITTTVEVNDEMTNGDGANESIDEEFKRLQIEKLKREADEAKKAQIRGNIVKAVKSGKELRIFNAGKVTARNVRVEWLNEDEGVYLMGDISKLGDITPQNVRVFPMALEMGHHETMNLRYHWDDDFAKDNTSDESLQL